MRPFVGGKFLRIGDDKLFVRGVTYGTFGAAADVDGLPSPDVARHDVRSMAANGVDAVRTYTVPPRWFLDLAWAHRLRVMVGIPWEQHVAFLDDDERMRSIERKVRAGVAVCARHPAVLCYAVGNEIPAPIVRWHGRRRVERFLERLYVAAKEEDPDGLVTYVNYPSTEYLQLPFLDLVAFNVFLEEEEALEAYLARLQNIAGDRPLLVTEIGLDSRRHGEESQAVALGWQIGAAFRSGCAGAFVFAWTDEWHRGGQAVDEWDFGVTDRFRRPKPALAAMRETFADVPFRQDVPWPRVSVVVCTHNGAETIADCLEGIEDLDYPDVETIVVDDGSADGTAKLARSFDVRLISTENRGLSCARNTGVGTATGEIVAFLDDDARPDRDWLRYLVAALLRTPHVGVGGPNIAPPPERLLDTGMVRAPGGPTHVLLTDCEAEHIPGCNMAFRTQALEAVGGFDAQFREAGDDVDICWRLRGRGGTLGFVPAAMVWHRRRVSVRAYLRQQKGYGKAEALLERKWPERYNRGGHLRWSGNVDPGPVGRGPGRWRIYYGSWGNGLFQSVYARAPGTLSSLPTMPEWHLLLVLLGALATFALVVEPLFFVVPGINVCFSVVLFFACAGLLVGRTGFTTWSLLPSVPRSWSFRLRLLSIVTVLHLLQPVARLAGRLGHGLTPWRRRRALGFGRPWRQRLWIWSESWRSSSEWLTRLEQGVRRASVAVYRGGAYDRWDLECRVGPLASARLRIAAEEHGQGRQLLRFAVWPVCSRLFAILFAGMAMWLALASVRDTRAGIVVGCLMVLLLVRVVHEAGSAIGLLRANIAQLVDTEEAPAVEALEGEDDLPVTASSYGVRAASTASSSGSKDRYPVPTGRPNGAVREPHESRP